MPRYQKGYAGKLIVQDWNVLDTYSDENSLRWITPRQMAALVSLAEFLGWKTRYANPPGQDTLDAFTAETRYNLMTEVAFCALVIGCITDDEDVRDALNQWFVDQLGDPSGSVYNALNQVYNAFQQGATMPDDVLFSSVTGSNPGCDLDKLWGWIDGGIEGMNANNIDALQIAEGETNIFERASTVLAAIPGIGVLPVDEVVTYIQGLWSDDLMEAYEENDTTEYRRVLKCDIFCLAQAQGCQVTLDMLYQYFLGRLSFDGTDTLDDVLQYLVNGSWSGTEVNDTFYLAQVLFLKYGNRFFKMLGIMSVQVLFALGDPSDDWMLLCETCPEFFSHRFDFTDDEQGWSAFSTYAQYSAGNGWIENTTGIVWITRNIPDSGRVINSVRFETSAGNQLLAQVGTPGDCSVGGVFDQPASSYTDTTTDVTGATGFDVPVTEIAARIAVNGFIAVTGTIVAVTVNGEGTDPF